jgi:group I intron endonuclease
MTDKEKLFELIYKLTDEEAEQVLSYLRKEPNREDTIKAQRPYHKFVYSIKNNVTGKEYIGRTNNVAKRVMNHMSRLQKGKHSVEDMQADYDLYGDKFTISILEEIKIYGDRKREYELIESHQSFIRGNGYNYNDRNFKRWREAKARWRAK